MDSNLLTLFYIFRCVNMIESLDYGIFKDHNSKSVIMFQFRNSCHTVVLESKSKHLIHIPTECFTFEFTTLCSGRNPLPLMYIIHICINPRLLLKCKSLMMRLFFLYFLCFLVTIDPNIIII